MTRWLSWGALALIVIAALVIGTRPTGERTPAERAQDIAATVACPACSGQSVASSDAPAAQNLRNEIERRVAAGESDDDIRAAIEARFPGSLLNPPRSGTAGLVWVIPVVAVVAAGAGLTFAFVRWRREW